MSVVRAVPLHQNVFMQTKGTGAQGDWQVGRHAHPQTAPELCGCRADVAASEPTGSLAVTLCTVGLHLPIVPSGASLRHHTDSP